jgi:hypothetical protein
VKINPAKLDKGKPPFESRKVIISEFKVMKGLYLPPANYRQVGFCDLIFL